MEAGAECDLQIFTQEEEEEEEGRRVVSGKGGRKDVGVVAGLTAFSAGIFSFHFFSHRPMTHLLFPFFWL